MLSGFWEQACDASRKLSSDEDQTGAKVMVSYSHASLLPFPIVLQKYL